MPELSLTIVTAERVLLSETVVQRAQITTEFGQLGVEPGHTPLLAKLKPGLLEYIDLSGARCDFYINGGLLEIQPAKITVLADAGFRSEELDANAIKIAEDNAKHQAKSENASDRSAALAQLSAIAVQKQLLKRRGL